MDREIDRQIEIERDREMAIYIYRERERERRQKHAGRGLCAPFLRPAPQTASVARDPRHSCRQSAPALLAEQPLPVSPNGKGCIRICVSLLYVFR